jgi:hypothetical protein
LLRDRDTARLHIPLPRGPLQSVDAFEYLSAAPSTWTAIDPSLYYVDVPGEQIVLTPCSSTLSFPSPVQDQSGFRVTFTAGYGAMTTSNEELEDGSGSVLLEDGSGHVELENNTTGNPVPPEILLAIKTYILHFYENREAYAAGKLEAVPAAGESLLMPHRAMNY